MQILLNADARPDLLTQPGYQRLIDSVQQLPGVLSETTKVRTLIAEARALLASRKLHRSGASIFHTNDTVAAAATLLEVQDAVSDTAGALDVDFTTTTLGDTALADGLSSFSFDSTFTTGRREDDGGARPE